MFNKSLLILLVVLSIIIYNKQILNGKNNEKTTTGLTNKLKIYDNLDYGFDFKYPANFKLQNFNDLGPDEFMQTHDKLQLEKLVEINMNGWFCTYICPIDKFLDVNNVKTVKDLDPKLQSKSINKIKYYLSPDEEGPAAMGGHRSTVFTYITIQNNHCFLFVQTLAYDIYDFATEGGDMPRNLHPKEEKALQDWITKQKNEYEKFLESVKFYNTNPGPNG